MIGVLIPLVLIAWTCLVIWRACDGFEIASEYLGRNLSDGVRGGTINAISSSIPEFLTTLIALFVLADEEGFAIGLGTTAGSALFNGMIIPAACILSVVGRVVRGQRIDCVRVSRKVLLRDGCWLLACELVLILVVSGSRLVWYQGVLLVSLYAGYLTFTLWSMNRGGLVATDEPSVGDETADDGDDDSPAGVVATVAYWISGGPMLDLPRWFAGEKQRARMAAERWNAWPLLLTSVVILSAACWLLVMACEWLGTGPANAEHPGYELAGLKLTGIGMPAMFVAVIFASMATSVPDTVMSIRDARDGDYDDAVANALGSNIFDICFALGLPLLGYTLLHGPINLGETIATESAQLRVMLLLLTILGLACFCFGPTQQRPAGDTTPVTTVALGRGNAYALIAIYTTFVIYIVGLSQGWIWASTVSDGLSWIVERLPFH